MDYDYENKFDLNSIVHSTGISLLQYVYCNFDILKPVSLIRNVYLILYLGSSKFWSQNNPLPGLRNRFVISPKGLLISQYAIRPVAELSTVTSS